MSSSTESPAPDTPNQEERMERLQRERDALEIEVKILELKVQKLQRELWGRKSERLAPEDETQRVFFEEAAGGKPSLKAPATKAGRKERIAPGPKPLDPALAREVIQVPAPDLKKLICPATGAPMRPGFIERLEVLARRAPEFYVKAYERVVFVSPAKTAPVYSPWPADVLPRARVHASVVAYVAAAHYCEHLPFNRIEQHLARVGVDLPRVCQVSLMAQLHELTAPLVLAQKKEVFGSGYIQLDATPIDLCDSARPGAVREATLWAYRSKSGAVWFEYQTSKSPAHPDATLRQMNFRGYCQTDAAKGLESIGPPGEVTSLGCHAHSRRYFFDAHQAGDPRAQWYLEQFGKLFRVERLAQRYGRRDVLRRRFSRPIFAAMLDQAETHAQVAPAKTDLGTAVRYLLDQQERLERCLTTPGAEISTNGVERAIRPLKLGAKNWLFIGDPSAGPRLANVFTLVENCRLLGVDPERYLIDIMGRLGDYPAAKINDLLPSHWVGSRSSVAA